MSYKLDTEALALVESTYPGPGRPESWAPVDFSRIRRLPAENKAYVINRDGKTKTYIPTLWLARLKKWRDRRETNDTLMQGVYSFNRGVEEVASPVGEVLREVAPEAADWYGREVLGIGREGQDDASRFASRVGLEVGRSLPFAALGQAAGPLLRPLARSGKTALTRILGQMGEAASTRPVATAASELAASAGAGAGAAMAERAAPGSNLWETTGQIAGSLAPGVAGLAAPGRIVAGVMKRFGKQPALAAAGAIPEAARPYMPGHVAALAERADDAFKDSATLAVKRQIGALTPTQRVQAARAGQLEEAIPGFTPTTAERTGAAGLLAQQRRLESKATGEDLNNLIALRQGKEQAVENFRFASTPDSPESPEWVVDLASGRVTSLKGKIDEAAEAAAKRQADVEAGLASRRGRLTAQAEAQGEQAALRRRDLTRKLPRAEYSALGASMREAQFAAERAAKAAMQTRRTELGIAADIDLTDTYPAWRDAVSGELADDLMRYPDVKGLLTRYGKEVRATDRAMGDVAAGKAKQATTVDPVTWERLQDLDQDLFLTYLAARSGPSPDFNKARVVSEIRTQLDGYLNDVADELGPSYKQYKQEYFTNVVEPFRNETAFKVADRNARGFYRTLDEDVAGNYWKAGGATAIGRWNAIHGADPAQAANMEAVVLDDLRDFAAPDGILDPKLVNRWLDRNRENLAQIPAIFNRISDIATENAGLAARQLRAQSRARQLPRLRSIRTEKVVEALVERQAQLQARREKIEDTKLARILAATQGLAMTPEQALSRAFQDRRLFFGSPGQPGLWNRVKRDPEAVAAWRRHVWDGVIDKAPADIHAFIDKYKVQFALLFSPRDIANIRAIADARGLLAQLPAPQGGLYTPRPGESFEQFLGGMTIPQIGTRIRSVQIGKAGIVYPVLEVLMRTLRGHSQQDMDLALRHAIYDPEFGRDLIEASETWWKARKPLSERAALDILRKLYPRLFTIGFELESPDSRGAGINARTGSD